jgi:S-adenosylmethionine-diacylglycerol 3-amino-3-carboxypropyl transferase
MYLRPKNFQAIRRRAGRIRFFLGPVEKAPGKFSGFNLSNIFEYMDSETHVKTYGKLLDKALPKARLAYWNLHVRRHCPASESGRARPLESLSLKLQAMDKSWAYKAFCVDEHTNQ